MTHRYAVPSDLIREPWWPSVRHLTLESALARVHDVDPRAARVLLEDVLDLNGVPPHASQYSVDALLAKESLGAWVVQWQPLKKLTAFGRIDALRKALEVLGRVLSPAPAPAPPDLGALGSMQLPLLAERTEDRAVPVPDMLSFVLSPIGEPETIAEFLSRPIGRRTEVAGWFRRLALDLNQGIEQGAPARAARLATWNERAASPAMTGLLALRERLAATELPLDEGSRSRSKWSWSPIDDRVHVEVPGLLSCMKGPCDKAAVSLVGETPTVSCDEGSAPCRLKLAAVEVVLDALAGDDPRAKALREHLARPGWQRMLERLQRAGDPAPPATGQLGWVLKSARELAPAWIEPKKSGGWKSTKVSARDMATLEPQHPCDGPALSILAIERYGVEPSGDQVAQALAALVGHDHVFSRFGKDLVPISVQRVEPKLEVFSSERGSRVAVCFGDQEIDSTSTPRIGQWLVKIDEARRLVRVGFWSRALHQAWLALRDEAQVPLPPEATTPLAETLIALGPRIPVARDASWLGEPLPPADDVVFRLGFEGPRGDKVLTIEARVQPVPELGAMVPGEGEDIIPVRRDGKVGHVARDLEREREDVTELTRELGLPPSPMGDFAWRVVGLEPAVQMWTALTAAAREGGRLRVEWKTKPLSVQRQRRVDKLQLRLGLKKDWLDVQGGFMLDGGELPLGELLNALRDKKRFVQVDDTRVLEIGEALGKELAPLAALARAGESKEGGKDAGSLRASLLAVPLIAELEALGASVTGPPEWLNAHARLAEAARLEVPVPAGLAAELRPYQKEGLTWAARLGHWAKGACLADEMGLGKTLQALALLLHRRPLGRALVVAPTSVVPNWLREAARFCPSLTVAGLARGGQLGAIESGADVVVTSWDLIVRHEERFRGVPWATLVLDEAHAMKNSATRRAQVMKELPAGFVLALTGTPVENRPSELWSLFQAVAPGLLGSAESFRETFGRPIAEGDADAVRRLARLARPFILRRTKAEVASDLPDKTEVRVDVILSADERERYERVRKSALAQLARDGLDALPSGQRIFKVLVVLTRLRQLACHPRLVEPDAGPGSSKIERLLELVGELREEGRKVLVFSQFTELLALVRAAFDEAGIRYAYLDGQTPAERRMSEVDRFQSGAMDAFVLSLKAGGVGLNLTAATEVIHLDPWWNPAVEDQATGRAHRIGQERPVTVYRLVAQGTIEEQILGLHGDKRQMVASLLEGTGSAAAVTAEELIALLSEEGLEASAPESSAEAAPEQRPARAASASRRITLEPLPLPLELIPAAPATPRPPTPSPAPEASPLTRVLDALTEAAGEPLKRMDLVDRCRLTESEWNAVRAALEDDARVAISGNNRGRSYRWVRTPATS